MLWAVVVGAGIKLLLNEGLARWQLATGETLLEGALGRAGQGVRIAFLGYFLVWSFLVAAALMSACGATFHALLPLTGSAWGDKVLYGLLHGLVGVVLVRLGGYRLFEKVMSGAIVLIFVSVVATALSLVAEWGAGRGVGWGAVVSGLLVPRIPQVAGGLSWTVALMGGVGGTLTVLCYGYWIREEGRTGPESLGACRIDLAAGYLMTALFGVAMVIVGATVEVSGHGAGLVVSLADRLEGALGPVARWTFLLGAWGAVASSLLGVWQSVPYLFADQWALLAGRGRVGAPTGPDTAAGVRDLAGTRPYRLFLYGLTTVPALGLMVGFAAMQRLYAIVGAAFMPMLAATLLMLAGRRRWIGAAHRNHPLTNLALVVILAFFTLLFLRALA